MHTLPSHETRTRVAVPVTRNTGLRSPVGRHFGRSPGFIIVDSDGSNVAFMETRSARRGEECAPIQALAEVGCGLVLCNSMGRGAFERCRQAGLQLFSSHENTVAEALRDLSAGAPSPCLEDALCEQPEHRHGHDHDHDHDRGQDPQGRRGGHHR